MIYVYAGYYELFITSHQLSKPFMYQAEFDTVKEAEEWTESNFDTENNTVYYESSIYKESKFYDELGGILEPESVERYLFDVTAYGMLEPCSKQNVSI